MIGALVEIAQLALRCSLVESAREWISTRFAFFHVKSSPPFHAPAVCVIAENQVWGGTEQHTRELIHWLLRRGLHVKYVTAGNHVEDPELTELENPALEWIKLPLSVEDLDRKKLWTHMLRSVKAHAVILPCTRVEFGSFAFLGAVRRSFRRVVYVEHATPTPLPDGFQPPHWPGLLHPRGQAHWIEYLRRRYSSAGPAPSGAAPVFAIRCCSPNQKESPS